MQASTALQLLSGIQLDNTQQPALWADLGCGDGFFTRILATKLTAKSRIYAVDRQFQFFEKITGDNIELVFRQADFISDELELPLLDGILMANSLHYVADKNNFIDKLKTILKPAGVFLVIEYDSTNSNQWVPYPLSFKNLVILFRDKGYAAIQKLGEVKSVYNRANIYACSIRA